MAEVITFDSDTVGAPPRGWTQPPVAAPIAGPSETDESAPSKSGVLKQSGRGDFPWCVKDTPSFADGRLEVKFKPLSGKKDQAGGLVWRWKDGDNYYVARANALENNVSLYYTQGGRQMTIKYVDAPVANFDPSTLRSLSEKLLVSHHENNYGGEVKRLNAHIAQLAKLSFSTAPGFEIKGLKREELIATNSMIRHELYFDCFGGDGTTMEPAMGVALTANFGSFERWREEFVAIGKALGGGSGWVLLAFQPRDGAPANQWASDHTQTLAGGVPIAALDMYEHSYHMDYGTAAAHYVDAVMENLDCARIHARYKAAVEAASEPFAPSQDDISAAILLDVRRAGVFDNASTVIPGSRWLDPARVAEWSGEQEPGRPVVVYCVYGHEVGRATALRLRAAGVDARFLHGGIDGWQKAGRPVSPKP